MGFEYITACLMQSFFFGGGVEIFFYKKKISRLNIRYTNYHETEKNMYEN